MFWGDECYFPECRLDSECDKDQDPCTQGWCGDKSQKCEESTVIDYCWNNDGCCPTGCYQSGAGNESDNDCAADFCQLTKADNQCPSGCQPETDWDCCLQADRCWIKNPVTYECFMNEEQNPFNKNEICDSNKSQNFWSETPWPDLTITKVQTTASIILPGTAIGSTVYVKNIGNGEATNILVHARGWTNCDDPSSVNISSLKPNEEKTVDFIFNCERYLDYREVLLFEVDKSRVIEESEEGNNSKSVEIPVVWFVEPTKYYEGDWIKGLEGSGKYEGKRVDLKIAAITQNPGYKVKIELYDLGIKESQTISANTFLNEAMVDSNGNSLLEDVVYIDDISVDPLTSEGYVVISGY